MSQQFFRMRQLAGIKRANDNNDEVIAILIETYLHANYYSKGVLRENLNEISLKGIYTNIKSRFTKLSSKNQKFVKKLVDLIKSKGDNPTEVLKTMADFVQQSGGLQQALKKLSSGDLQEADSDKESKPSTDIGIVKQKYGSLAASLMLTAAMAGASQQLINTVGSTVDAVFDKGIKWSAQYNQNTFQQNDPGVIDWDTAKAMMSDPTTDSVNRALDDAIQNTQSSPTNIEADFTEYNVDDKGTDLTDDENSAVVVTTYDVGEYELSQSEIDKAAEELANKIVAKIKQDFQDNPDKKIESVKISPEEISSISRQDKDSNVANDGSDLGKGRMDTSSEIKNKAVDITKDKLQPLIDQDIEIEFTDPKEIDAYTSVDKQKVQKAQDGLSTQSSVVKADIEIKYGEKGIPLNYIPTFFDPDAGDQKDFSPVGKNKGETPRETPREKPQEKPGETPRETPREKSQEKPQEKQRKKSQKETPPIVTKISQAIQKDTGFKNYLGKIDRTDELSNFILALFLYKDNKGDSLFSPDKLTSFDSDASKVRSAIFGLKNKIPNTITEDELTDNVFKKFPDVQAAYTYIGKSSTLRNLLKDIDTMEEFHSFVIKAILPHINPQFKTEEGIKKLKGAIIRAANQTKEFDKILKKTKTK